MAKLGDLIVKIGADTREFNKELRSLEHRVKNTNDAIMGMGQRLSMGLTLPIAGLGLAAVKAASDLQTMEVQFRSLTGGAEQAAAMVDRLNQFAAATPYEIEGIASAARQLMASGTDVEDVTSQLQFLGDIAATASVPIEEMAGIFAKVQAKGKVELENLNQLAERGIPIFEKLSEATGLPASELGAGRVSVEQYNAVLREMAMEGGFAYQAMENLSQTASGKFSTALDQLKMAGASIGEFLLPYATAAIDKITELAKKFEDLDDRTKKIIIVVAGVAAAIGPMLMGISAATKAYKAFTGANEIIIKLMPKVAAAMGTNPIGLAAIAVAGAVALIIMYWDEIVAYFTTGDGAGIFEELKMTVSAAMDAVKQIWDAAVAIILSLWEKFGGNIMQAIDTAMDFIMGIVRAALGMVRGFLNAWVALFNGDWRGFLNGMRDLALSGMQAVVTIIFGALRQIGNGVDTFLNAVGIETKVGPWLDGLQARATAYFESLKSNSSQAKVEVKALASAVEALPDPGGKKPKPPKAPGGAPKGTSNEVIKSWTGIEEVMQPLTSETQRISAWAAALPETINLEEITEAADIVVDDFQFDQIMFEKFSKAKSDAQEWAEFTKQMLEQLGDTAMALGAEFGTAFGQILTGAEGGGEALKAFASQAVDAGFQAATALAIQAAAQTSTAAGPGAAIVLPALITAGMSLMREVFRNITGFAEGGIVSGPTMGLVGEYPGAKSNPEVIAPLNKLRSILGDTGGNVVVTGRLQGRDLILSNERTTFNRYRTKG